MGAQTPFLRDTDRGLEIRVHAVPGAKRSALKGLHDQSLKISIAAPPEDGRANAELIDFLAQTLGVPKRHLSLLRGEGSREKIVLAVEISATDAAAKLGS